MLEESAKHFFSFFFTDWKIKRTNEDIINKEDNKITLSQLVLSKVLPLYAILAIAKTHSKKRKFNTVFVILSFPFFDRS